MNDRIPRTERDHVLVGVKATPSEWPTATPTPGAVPARRAGSRPTGRSTNLRSLRFQGIATS